MFGVEPDARMIQLFSQKLRLESVPVHSYCKRLDVTASSPIPEIRTSAGLGSLCGGRAVNRGRASSELGVGTGALCDPTKEGKLGKKKALASLKREH